MYTLIYALRTLIRNRGRYLLFAAALTLLFAFCFINLSLGNTSSVLVDALIDEFGTKMRVYATSKDYPYLTQLSIFNSFNNPELVEAIEPHTAIVDIDGWLNDDPYEADKITWIWHIGINREYSNQFDRKKDPAVLLEGRLWENDQECVITDEFYNQLRENGHLENLGDTLTQNQGVGAEKNEDGSYSVIVEPFTYTVVGIVDHNTIDPRYQSSEKEPLNVMFTSFDAASKIIKDHPKISLSYSSRYYTTDDQFTSGYEVIYRLHDYRDADKFADFVEEKVYQTFLDYRSNVTDRAKRDIYRQYAKRGLIAEPIMPEFEQILTPLEQIQTFTGVTTFTIAVLAIAVVGLMSVINMRARKYELGVLRCVGMSKGRISLTLGIESMAFLLITAALGIALGFGFAALFGDTFVDLNIVDTTIDTMAISGAVALRLVIAALGLSVFATVISAAFVMRARPLAILRNRT